MRFFQILIYLIIIFGGTIDLKEVKSETCNANPSSTYESWWGDGSNTSWSELVGNCDKTPEEYGVTVYKMGFCTTNPFEGLAYDGTPGGVSPNFNDCSWSYENSNGEFQMFGPNSSTKLSAAFSKRPNNGSYSFAVIEIGPYISIKQMYGPIEGKTFYTSNYLDQHNGLQQIAISIQGQVSYKKHFKRKCVILLLKDYLLLVKALSQVIY